MAKNWGKILRRELLPQFLNSSHEIWYRCLPWGVDLQDSFFDSGRKCVAMVMAYYGKKFGENNADWTTITFFEHLKWNLAHMLAMRWRCARHIFWQWRKVRCHGNGISWQKMGKTLRIELLPHFLAFKGKFGTHRRSYGEMAHTHILVEFSILRFSIISIVHIPFHIFWNSQFLIRCNFCVIITFVESCHFICPNN